MLVCGAFSRLLIDGGGPSCPRQLGLGSINKVADLLRREPISSMLLVSASSSCLELLLWFSYERVVTYKVT